MIEIKHLGFLLDTLASNLVDSTTFRKAIICKIVTQKRLITPVTQFAKSTMHDQVHFTTAQTHSQETVRVLLDDRELEPVEIRSPPERSASAFSSDENEKSHRKRRSRLSSKTKSKKSFSSLFQNESSPNSSSNRSRQSISVLPLVNK